MRLNFAVNLFSHPPGSGRRDGYVFAQCLFYLLVDLGHKFLDNDLSRSLTDRREICTFCDGSMLKTYFRTFFFPTPKIWPEETSNLPQIFGNASLRNSSALTNK